MSRCRNANAVSLPSYRRAWLYRGSSPEPHAGHESRQNLFRKTLKQHGQPRTITLDGFEPSHAALRRMGMRNEFNYRFENPVRIRSSQYLNNIVEHDHRPIKFRLLPMLGFKFFTPHV